MQGLRAGAYDYLAKPFEVDDLRKAVRNAAEKQRLLESNRRYLADLERTLTGAEELANREDSGGENGRFGPSGGRSGA